MRFFKISIAAILFFLLSCGISFAQLVNPDLPDRKGIKAGDMILHSAFKVQEQIETNIFLNNTDRKADGITILKPSVGIEVPLQDNGLSFDYEMGIFLYNKYRLENHIDHRVRGLAEINLTDYKITVKDVYRIYTDRAADENSRRLKRDENDLRAGIAAQFDQLGFDLGYTNRIEMYDSKDLYLGSLAYEDRNRIYNIIDATIAYRFLPKTFFLLENDLGFIHYYNSSIPPDSYYDEILAGFRGEWFAKANVDFRAGFRYQNYDNSDVLADKDYIGPVIRGGFDYHPTKDDDIVVNAVMTVYESTYANMNYYNANLIGATYRHRFNRKLSADLFGSYQLHLYPSSSTENGETGKRWDNYFEGGAGLRYDVQKWLSFDAKYRYTQRISKFEIFDYFDNIVTIGGTVGF